MANKTIAMYGLSICSTVKKARAWLDEHGVAHTFHCHRDDGVDRARIEGWIAKVGWEKLLNKAGYTFRGLPDERKADLDEAKAIELLMEHPALIKRPLVELDGEILLGFRAPAYEKTFTA